MLRLSLELHSFQTITLLHVCFRYYYDGCASWRWFYPFHYAPFASDLVDIATLEIDFDPGKPFAPFNQLMGVFPAASSHALPECFRWLFTSPKSPILDFYPSDFAVDMNGKRFAWQGVALLPFIDETRLLAATDAELHNLSEEERFRNTTRLEVMYVHNTHSLAPTVFEIAEKFGSLSAAEKAQQQEAMDPETSRGVSGFLLHPDGDICPPVVHAPFNLGEDLTSNDVLCVVYKLPPHKRHEPRIMVRPRSRPLCFHICSLCSNQPLKLISESGFSFWVRCMLKAGAEGSEAGSPQNKVLLNQNASVALSVTTVRHRRVIDCVLRHAGGHHCQRACPDGARHAGGGGAVAREGRPQRQEQLPAGPCARCKYWDLSKPGNHMNVSVASLGCFCFGTSARNVTRGVFQRMHLLPCRYL